MQLRHRNHFTTIRTEGSILPADLLQRIVAARSLCSPGDRDAHLKGLTPDDYHLAGGLKLNEAINQSWNRLQGEWAVFQNALNALPLHDSGTTLTREKWLLTLFQELGYGRLPVTRGLEVEGKSHPVSHLWQRTAIHLVSARVDLDTRSAVVAGASRISPHALGWMPPQLEEDGETGGRGDWEKEPLMDNFQLRPEDARPQPGLFDEGT